MLENIGRIYLVLGPMIIIGIGILLTVVLAITWQEIKRWIVLFAGPLLTLLIVFLVTLFITRVINPAEGSGFLLGAVSMGLYFTGLFVYYPVLIIVAIVRYFRSRKKS